jgi:hypothetical protein
MSQEYAPMRSMIFNNVNDVVNDTHKAYYHLFRYHVPESISQFFPYVNRYSFYRALPTPTDPKKFGVYNFLMTEHYWTINAYLERHISTFNFYNNPEFKEIMGQNPGGLPLVFVFLPIFWEEEFKGGERTFLDGPNYRWTTVLRYPDGVSEADGDKWLFETAIPKLAARPEVTRILTSKLIKTALPTPFYRSLELWFNDAKGWRSAIENTQYPKPSWAQTEVFPYLKPFEQFSSMFLMDKADTENLSDYSGYITAR